jgi:hypothetical protein
MRIEARSEMICGSRPRASASLNLMIASASSRRCTPEPLQAWSNKATIGNSQRIRHD